MSTDKTYKKSMLIKRYLSPLALVGWDMQTWMKKETNFGEYKERKLNKLNITNEGEIKTGNIHKEELPQHLKLST